MIFAIAAFVHQDRCDIVPSARPHAGEQDPRPFARSRVPVVSMDEVCPGSARPDGGWSRDPCRPGVASRFRSVGSSWTRGTSPGGPGELGEDGANFGT